MRWHRLILALIAVLPAAAGAQGFGTILEEEPPTMRRLERMSPPPPPPPPHRPHPAFRVPHAPTALPGQAMRFTNGPFVLVLQQQRIRGDQAPIVCQQLGMRIAWVNDWQENALIARLLAQVPASLWPPGVWHGAWIGLQQTMTGWRWLNGRPMGFEAFGRASGEPRGDGPFVAVELARAGNPDGWWNDAPATESYAGVICRR